MAERDAFLCFNDWAGLSREPVVVVGETPTRYRVRPPDGVDVVRLAGRNRYLHRGDTALVPKGAVSLSPLGPHTDMDYDDAE